MFSCWRVFAIACAVVMASKKKPGNFGWQATTVRLVGWVAAAADEMAALRDVRPRRHIESYASTAAEMGRELVGGVHAESSAGRGANAMRLARHLYEQELVLHYVAERPAVRLPQLEAEDAKARVRLARLNTGLRLTKRAAADFHGLIAKAEAKPTRGVPFDERGFPPNYEEMAKALDRITDDYDLFYRGASQLSHPTLLLAETYLEMDDAGVVRLRRRIDGQLVGQALALGLRAAVSLANRANWIVGPLPGFESRLDALIAHVTAGEDPVKVWRAD